MREELPGLKAIRIERERAVDWLTLNRPDRLNTLTGTMVRELCQYFDGLRSNYDTRIVVMRGAGRAFCAGLDIREHLGGDRVPEGAGWQKPGYHLFDIVRLMRACPQPVIALVHGPACGGGFAMALAADIRIAGELARMNDAFVSLGRSGCELGLSYFLPRIVGLGVATELMYTGAFIEAARAREVGLVSRVVPDNAMEKAAGEFIDAMLRTAPLGLRLTKETLNSVLKINDLNAVIDLEERAQSICGRGPDFEEAMRAFLEKRPPDYSRPA